MTPVLLDTCPYTFAGVLLPRSYGEQAPDGFTCIERATGQTVVRWRTSECKSVPGVRSCS